MPYTPLDQLQFTKEPPAGSFSLGRSLHSDSELLFFHAGGRIHVVHTDTWQAFDAAGAHSPVLVLTGLQIEPDLSSAFDPQREYTANGTFALSGDEPSLYLQFLGSHQIYSQDRLALIEAENTTLLAGVAFSRWALVRGSGKEREIVREFDVGRADAPVR